MRRIPLRSAPPAGEAPLLTAAAAEGALLLAMMDKAL